MSRNFYITPAYQVCEDRFSITVTESGDFPGENVVVYTKGPGSVEYFGNLRVDMPIEFMRKLAQTINKVCDEVESLKEQND